MAEEGAALRVAYILQGFSTSALFTFGAIKRFAVGDSPVHFKMISHIPGLYPVDSCSTALPHLPSLCFRVVTTKTSLGIAKYPGAGGGEWGVGEWEAGGGGKIGQR